MRRLFRLLLLAAAATGLIKLARNLLEGRTGQLGGVPAAVDLPEPREASEESAARSGAREARGKGTAGLTRAELYERAKELEIEGRSKMSKSALQRAVEEREEGGQPER